MTIIAYVLSIISFYLTYLLSTVIFGILGTQFRRLIYKLLLINDEVRLNGQLLSFVAFCSTMTSFFSALPIFIWCGVGSDPNWFILTPIYIYIWYKFSPALYSPFFYEGTAQIGFYLGVLSWLSIIWTIYH